MSIYIQDYICVNLHIQTQYLVLKSFLYRSIGMMS